MREALVADLKTAMKTQDKCRVSTLRLINAAIKDRDIAARSQGKDCLTDAEVLEILAKMIRQRIESAKTYEEAGRLEMAEREREEISVITEYLPKQLDEDEMRSACAKTVDEIGAAGLRDMGRTMSALKERFAGKMDFSRASCMVKEILRGAA
ncbi:MAG: GatB/YqeY domain-containing protein [Pseudomonadota bacterium]